MRRKSRPQSVPAEWHGNVPCRQSGIETFHMRRKSRPQSVPAEWHGNVTYATVTLHAHEIHHPLHSQRSNPLHTPPPLDNHVKPQENEEKIRKPELYAFDAAQGKWEWKVRRQHTTHHHRAPQVENKHSVTLSVTHVAPRVLKGYLDDTVGTWNRKKRQNRTFFEK
jgi:hypothetical protein